MKKSSVIEDMQKEIAALKEAGKPKEKDEDETVCPTCGNELELVEDGVVYCSKCKEYFEYDE